MVKTIVSIVSEQTIPNYLFIREMYTEGDSLLFISSDKFKERIQWIVNTLNYPETCAVESVLFPQESEEKWEDMKVQLTKSLFKEKYYFVNLTGGTKYMSLLTLSVFQDFDARFAYIPYPKNCILIPTKNDSLLLHRRLSIKEYMSCYNVSYTKKEPTKLKSYTEYFFNRFIEGSIDLSVMDLLRNYRDKKKIYVDMIESKVGTDKYPQIENLDSFIKDINFPYSSKNILYRNEIGYLTGGWFEEYMYHKIEEYIHPQDIQLGVSITRSQNHNQNELDIVFTSGNKLFVIECKTGLLDEKLFNGTVYKAVAIKESVLGLSANTFIVSVVGKNFLSNTNIENDKLKKTAKNMGISYKCREDVLNILPFMEEIKRIAQD